MDDCHVQHCSCGENIECLQPTASLPNHSSIWTLTDIPIDPDSKLGTYLLVNPELEAPVFDNKFEFQRTLITRYRTGSHNLRIEKDRRIPNSSREDRLCLCNTGIQTIKHVLVECPMLQTARVKYGVDSVERGISSDDYLMEMECILGIKS